MHGVGRFMSQDAQVIVGSGKAGAVKDAVSTAKTLRESAALAMVARHNVHAAILGIEQRCQFTSVIGPEGRQRLANDLASLTDCVARRGGRYFRAGSLLEWVGAQPLISLINVSVLRNALDQILDFCFGPVTIEIP